MRDFKALVRERVAPLALAADREQKIVDEWAAELGEIHDALRADGLSDEDAWHEVRRHLPDTETLAEDLLVAEPIALQLAARSPTPRARRTFRAMVARARERLAAGLLRDVRLGLRLLVHDRGFSATVILTLAICLGANAAIFTVVNAVLLRPLPVPESDRIVGMGDVYPTITPNDILTNDVPSYFDRLEALTTMEEQALFTYWYDTLPIDGVPQELRGMRVTPSIFRLLRVPPAIGRAFTDAEAESGATRVIVLSDGLWQTLYGGDPAAVGQTLRLGWTGERYTIVGVMPRGFSFLDEGEDGHAGGRQGVQFWIPMVFTPEQRTDAARSRYGFTHIGRLKPGATVEQVRERLAALRATNARRFPQFRYDELGMYTSVLPLQEALTRRVRRTLYLLWAGAGFVLLIGAINIANLSLARASARRRELATRLALGAGRFQVARQLMVEALPPAVVGGLVGLVVGALILRALAFAGLANLPNAAGIGMDAATVAFVALAMLAVALLIGLTPAATVGAITIQPVLAEGSRSGTSGRSARAFRRGLVVAQVALSVVLLIAGTLLLTSFRHLLQVDAGFAADGVVTATVFPPPSRYPEADAVSALLDRIRERVLAVPGVRAAGFTSNVALSGYESPSTVTAAGRTGIDDPPLVPSVIAVTAGYFDAMGTPLVRGRGFDDRDHADAKRVAIVDESLARRLWPDTDAIGQAIYRGDAGPFSIVGVVRNVRFESLAGSIDAIGTAYFPQAQAPPLGRLRWLAIRSAGEPAAVVRAVRAALVEIDPDLPLSDIQTMAERTSRSLVSERLAMSLAAMFALTALFLSMLGIYAVLANVVARRTREIGIRMALGSPVSAILRLVLAEGVVLIGAGLVLGVGGAIVVARALTGVLFGVEPTDPLLLGSVALVTGAVALLACLAPARRASRVDPVRVLSEP
jgi:putative ABC transport system permease protein